jgi:hypothetical protein
MSEVRRFDVKFEDGDILERPDGAYVEYSDYAAAEARIEKMKCCGNCDHRTTTQCGVHDKYQTVCINLNYWKLKGG